WSAYRCATANYDPNFAPCQGQTVLTDGSGNVIMNEDVPPRPVLIKYPGAFGSARTPFAVGKSSGIKVLETKPFIRAAKTQVPIHATPFDPGSPAENPHVTLVPWRPKGSGAGFPIAINGSQEKFINTHELDFSGTTISLNVNYEYPIDPKT